jgi:plasmid stability protein
VKADHKNVTLSLPEPLLRKFRVYAAQHNKSMTSLMTEAIERMVAPDDDYEERKRRLIEGMRNAPNLGTGGKITWKREDLYDRGVR